ncbi:uncharacterized protein LOC116187847 isoform X2 [Punica granatum]|uniref:Enhancer of polycomb-like protein n=1 Tax=Punica granatum TaxID=22663 RepID=A0A6P8BQS6_PUNGR|nr:uncharacterized protein LOC116187847 isoform X2 [Punica granatum]
MFRFVLIVGLNDWIEEKLMENRVGSSHGAQTPKRSRSLDLKSLYKSKASKESSKEAWSKTLKRKGSSVYSSGEENSKKRIKKDALVSNPKNADRNSKKSLAELYNGDLDAGLKGSGSTERENGISLSLSGDAIRIPKRKRGFVGRKKVEAPGAAELPSQSASVQGSSDQATKLEHDDAGNGVNSASDMHAESIRDTSTKEDRACPVNLDQHPKEEADLPAKSNDPSLKKPRKNRRKKKNVEATAGKFVQVAEPLNNDSARKCNDMPEEDEENLEENAAMMLSSRFDPSCTGFGSNSKASMASKSKPSFSSYGRNSASCHDRSGPASLDANNWKLRPRKQHKERGLMRKRRHFYDIVADELDPLWVLDKKIKVFWPLDEKWYYGLVNDYDEERKLHHIKYDDRDEEWVDLRNEKIKILLLRCEVPGMAARKNAASVVHKRKQNLKPTKEGKKRGLSGADDNGVMDSEPIISWLARSKTSTSLGMKRTSISHGVKKQKISPVSLHPAPSLLNGDKVSLKGSVDDGSLRRKERKSHPKSALADRPGGSADSGLKSAISLKERKLPIVYVRRHFRKSTEAFLGKKEDGDFLASDLTCGVSASTADKSEAIDCDISLGKSDPHWSSWSIADSSLQELNTISFKPGECRFELCIPINSFSSHSLGARNLWLFHALPQQGMLMILWPKVHLEMLFVDSVVGLRFLLFEGSLKEAVEFIFLVLALFAPSHDEEKNIDIQVPATSISFKFASVQGCRRQLVFAFYNFFKLKPSKWMYLDLKLMRHCLLTKWLPLSECTYDNIRLLQNGTSRLPASSQCGPSLKKKYRPGKCQLSALKGGNHLNANHSCNFNRSCRSLPPFALSFAAAPTFFLGLHLQLLMKHTVFEASALTVWEHDSAEHPENDEADSGKTDIPNDHPDTNLHASGASKASLSLDLGTDEHSEKNHAELERSPGSPTIRDIPQKTYSRSLTNGISVEIPQFNQLEKPVDRELRSLPQPNDLASHANGGIIPSPNPTAPRTVWHRTRSSLSCGNSSRGWADVKVDSLQNGFVSGPKKPRTQVSYLLPLSGFDLSSKHRSLHPKNVPHKRIRRPNEKRASDTGRRNFDLLSCEANVLVKHGDRGWRECGAQIVLELAEQNEWKLAVKISGKTQFSYKAHQFLQPGSTNRYTHAMMWKGGKDWTLEFPDRGQWALFKEMHEECYNRNIRAASVKSIPIPGVHLVDENDDSAEGMFIRSSTKYYRQVETDVEMALNPSRVLYDMDSEDEKWISENQSPDVGGRNFNQLSEEVFERTMDMFEKAAYVQQRDQFTPDKVEELVSGASAGPLELTKTIYEHWRQKRQKKGMPLIRHLQPPSWERYKKQVKEWEQIANKANSALPNGCKKAPATEKPPMFAFCMKPRGLEVPNKGSKQRSHKKMSVSGHNHVVYGGDHDGFHAYGRRSNGYTFGDERVIYPGHNYEYLEDYSPLARFSSRDVSNHGYFSMGSDGYYYPALRKNKSKKFGSLISPHDRRIAASYSPRAATGWKNGVHHRNYQLEAFRGPLDGSEMDEFTIRDASGTAEHARNLAKLKRERARRMFDRADLAIHKAVTALMTAEAMKASSEDLNGRE